LPNEVRADRADRIDDVSGGNAEALEELLGFSAARDLTDGQAMHREPDVGYRFGHRVADAARRVVIFHRDQPSLRGATSLDETVAIDRRDGVQIDHPDRGAAALS